MPSPMQEAQKKARTENQNNMSTKSPQEEEVAAILEEKLKELRFGYEDELQKLMDEIKTDAEMASKKEDEDKLAELQSQLGL